MAFPTTAKNETSKLENKNPADNDGWTPLDAAAHEGHFKICEFILEKLENKNPGRNDGWTPLHSAAQSGHFMICEFIDRTGYSGVG